MKKFIFPLLLLLFAALSFPAYAEVSPAELTEPEMTVYLSNADTGSGNANTGKATRVHARVTYMGCTKGTEYVFVMRLEDESTGIVSVLSDGTAEIRQPFTAEGKVGIFEFEFSVDTAKFAGRTLVEIHYLENMAPPDGGRANDDSGRLYVPAAKINAVSETGKKTVLAGKNTVICGVLSYSGLAPNEEYKIVISLRDTLSGKLICNEDDSPVSAASVFTPEEASGQIAAKITADLREYGDRDISVSEKIYVVPQTGFPVLLMSGGDDAGENRTVSARLAQINIIDEMYKTPVSGVELKITSLTDGCTYEGVSDENGKIGFPLDLNSRNTCTVVSAPEEYHADSEPLEFSPTDSGDEPALSICLLKKNTVLLKRTDAETGLPLTGIVTEVRSSDGELLSSISSDGDGKAYFDAGLYCKDAIKRMVNSKSVLTLSFKDTSTPSEYYPRVNRWSISIDESGSITGLTELQSYKRYPVTLSVVNRKGEGIPGVELSIYGESGALQGRAITDHEGKIYFTPKRTGEYKIIEDSVPTGYSHSAGIKKFTVGANGEVSGTVSIKKLSEDFTGNVLTVIVLTVIFLSGLASAGFYLKKKFPNKMPGKADDTGRHSK